MFDDISERSDDEVVTLPAGHPAHLKTGLYTISTADGTPLGCERKEEVSSGLVVTQSKTTPSPKVYMLFFLSTCKSDTLVDSGTFNGRSLATTPSSMTSSPHTLTRWLFSLLAKTIRATNGISSQSKVPRALSGM